jgi:hypothetical protein
MRRGCPDAHIAAGGGRFRGIRRGALWHASPDIQNHRTNPPEGLLLRDDFRAGFKHLGPRKLSFEVWCAHTQIPDAISLARAFPDTTIVLDHFGGPIGIGPYAGKQDEVFGYWKGQIDELARCPNVVAKLGGLNMEVNGYGWERPSPPTSTELMQSRLLSTRSSASAPIAACSSRTSRSTSWSCSYTVLWNLFKRLSKSYWPMSAPHCSTAPQREFIVCTIWEGFRRLSGSVPLLKRHRLSACQRRRCTTSPLRRSPVFAAANFQPSTAYRCFDRFSTTIAA